MFSFSLVVSGNLFSLYSTPDLLGPYMILYHWRLVSWLLVPSLMYWAIVVSTVMHQACDKRELHLIGLFHRCFVNLFLSGLVGCSPARRLLFSRDQFRDVRMLSSWPLLFSKWQPSDDYALVERGCDRWHLHASNLCRRPVLILEFRLDSKCTVFLSFRIGFEV